MGPKVLGLYTFYAKTKVQLALYLMAADKNVELRSGTLAPFLVVGLGKATEHPLTKWIRIINM